MSVDDDADAGAATKHRIVSSSRNRNLISPFSDSLGSLVLSEVTNYRTVVVRWTRWRPPPRRYRRRFATRCYLYKKISNSFELQSRLGSASQNVRSLTHSINPSVSQSVSQSINQSLCQSVSQSVSQSISDSSVKETTIDYGLSNRRSLAKGPIRC